jgi:hypothetical protein
VPELQPLVPGPRTRPSRTQAIVAGVTIYKEVEIGD